MSKLIKLALVSSCLVLSTQAIANNGFYLGGKLGTSFVSIDDQNYKYNNLLQDYSETNDWGSKTKNAFNLGILAGYDFYPTHQLPIRLELDYAFRPETKSSLSSQTHNADGVIPGYAMDMQTKVTLHTTMLSAYYDFHNSSDFTPYVGAGIGLGLVDSKFTATHEDEDDETTTISKSKTNFAWSLNAGVSYKINDNLAADFGYRYLDAGEVKITGSSEVFKDKLTTNFTTHDVTIGLRYSF